MCHIYVRADGLAGVLIADHEYPQRVAHTLLTKVLKTFCSNHLIVLIVPVIRFWMTFPAELSLLFGQRETLPVQHIRAWRVLWQSIKILERQML